MGRLLFVHSERLARLIRDASSDATAEVRAGLKIGEEGRGLRDTECAVA
jgi:hypothetical protein